MGSQTVIHNWISEYACIHHRRYMNHHKGILQCGEDIGLNTEYRQASGDWHSRSKHGGQWMGNYYKEMPGVGEMWAQPTEMQPHWRPTRFMTHHWWKIRRPTRYQGEEFWFNRFSMLLLKLGFPRKHRDAPRRSFRKLTQVRSSKKSLSRPKLRRIHRDK